MSLRVANWTRKHPAGAVVLVAVVGLIAVDIRAVQADEPVVKREPRRPVALAAVGEQLAVANRRTGTVSLIDFGRSKVVAEHPVAARIADMISLPGKSTPGRLLVLDDDQHRLLLVTLEGMSPTVAELTRLPKFPVRMLLTRDPNRLYISSLWSRRLTILDWEADFAQIKRQTEVTLPFAPRELLDLPDQRRLVVAGAFGGQLAVVDTDKPKVNRVRKFPGHNIRGLTLSEDGKTIYVSHQKLDSKAWTDRDDVHWGILMANSLHGVNVAGLLSSESPKAPVDPGWLEPLGLVGRAAGDPGPVLIDTRGRLAVALSGVGEVAVTGSSYALTLPVGRRPVAMLSHGDQLLVANQFSDSITVIDWQRGRVDGTISLGQAAQLTARDRGELLFFDARLSHDRWMSCHSCHTEGHTSGLRADTLGDGGFGAPKRIPSLLGTRETGPWAWDGSAEKLADQIRKSIRVTMHGRALADRQVSDLVAYLNSLQSPPPARPEPAGLVTRGREIFTSRQCVDCHRPPTYTTPDTYDVDLVDEVGRRKFNPPSLRGVAQRERLFHDGRAHGIRDVIGKFRHQLSDPLSDRDSDALTAFLNSLK